ncbi:MAG: threonine/serine dehydratase [Candidatus Bathyarchaeota archaeon]|nr:MAG: threonine/serine dehydratase [Candidatus Bathyarchaeota archaeon]
MFKRVEEAHERIRGFVRRTPVMTSSTLDSITGSICFLKCESFQKTGSFKFRGALNAVSVLSEEQKRKGVITHSSGNHAQALALAARLFGIKAVVVMPQNAPPAKMVAARNYGAEIVVCGSHPADRERAVLPLIKDFGYTLIHPFNDLSIIAGAGTAAYELVDEVGNLDYVFCPVGGGGLLSGTAIAARGLLSSSVKIIGVEPENADDACRSLKAGKIIPVESPNTIADGLRTSLGHKTFQIIKERVDKIVAVSEQEIVNAMRFLWERMKLVVEPSGAVSLAGVLSKQLDLTNRVGVIVSGGNIDLTDLFSALEKSLKIS